MRHLALLAALLLAAPAPAEAAAPSLPFTQESNAEEYLIRFTNQDSHAFPISQAQDAADALDRAGNDVPGNPKGHHDGFVDLGFLEPYFSGDRLVDFWDCKDDDDTPCDNGQATTARIRMPTSVYSTIQNPGGTWSTEMCMRMVLGHELFHHVEFAYVDEAGGSGCGPWPAAACEGMARMMQDQIYTDIDTAASICASAQGQFDAYLGDTNRTLWDLSYTAALFWKYLAEQYGNVMVEPERGADFIRRWWENAVDDFDTPDIVQLTRETVQDFGGAGVDAAFHNFTIANIAKDFDLSPLSASEEARWSYFDSGQGFFQEPYAAIDDVFYPDVSPGDPYPFFAVVFDYGADYHGATVDQCPAGSLLRFKVTPWIENMVALGVFGLLIRRDDEVFDVKKKVGTTWHYARTQPQLRYTHLAASFGALADVAWLEYEFRCSVDIQVDFPLLMRPKPTHGGPPDSFAVAEVDVLVLTADPVEPIPGIDPVSFDIDLGASGSALRAPALATLRTPLGYRLLYAPPAGLGAGAHRVAVGVGSASAEGTSNTLLLGEAHPDVIVLLDRSQSMTTPVGGTSRFDLARRAAESAADGLRDGAQLGLVAFAGNGTEPDDDAIEAFELTALAPAARTAFEAALTALPPPSGPTSIGDGLAAAARMFGTDGATNQERHAILLSDGAESEALLWPAVRSAVLESDMRVHAIALGQNADQGLLAEIATETRGTYQFVSETPAETLPTRLADAFARAADRAEGRQRFFESGPVAVAAGGTIVPIEIAEQDLDAMRVRLDWDDPSDAVSAILRAPDGTTQAPATFKEFTITKKTDRGVWELELTPTAGAPEVRVTASAQPGSGAYLVTSVSHGAGAGTTGRTGGFDRHQPIVIEAAFLDANGPIEGAVAEVRIDHPRGGSEIVALRDDGRDADQVEGDGIYSASYRGTTIAGQTGQPETAPGTLASYPVHFRLFKAEGTPVRHASESIWVGSVASADVDADGLPDAWEALHLCLGVGTPDATLDPDGDGLTNAQELELGTDPCRSDTDGGGENDGSEVARGAHPLDPRDDLLPAPGWLSVVNRIYELHVPDDPRFVPQPFANLLRVPSAREYAALVIERRQTGTASPVPWAEIARPDPRTLGGAFLDDALPEGATFEYRMRGVDAAGNESAVSKVIEATVKADPIAPIGALRIAHGPRTDDTEVDLDIDLYLDDEHEIEMDLVVGASAGGRSWKPYAAEASIALPRVEAPTSTVVSATLRDAAGNESLTYAESILQYPRGSLGSIRGVAERAGSGPNEGIFVSLADRPGEVVVLSAADGSFVLDDLLPGTYDVELAYLDLVGEATNVVVVAGAETDVGAVLVPEPGAIAAMLAAIGTLLAVRRRYAGGSR